MTLNKTLQIINFFFILVTLYLYKIRGSNEFIDGNTIFLGVLLALEVHFFLAYSKKKINPFIIIVCFQLVFHYLMRIATLVYNPFSVVLNRNSIISDDTNYTLIFIIISNLFLFAGLYTKSYVESLPKIENNKQLGFNIKNIILLFLFASLLGGSNIFGVSFLDKIFEIVKLLFLNPTIIIFLTIVLVIKSYPNFSFSQKLLFSFLFVGYMVSMTLNGSRAGAYTIAIYILIALLSESKILKFKIKHLLIITFSLPIVFLVFIFATELRSNDAIDDFDSKQKIEIVKNSLLQKNGLVNRFATDVGLGIIFDRIGFLDYSTEIIAYSNEYSSIFNLPYYFMSTVDNALSPGFNVFDKPKVANALSYVYSNRGSPSLKSVDKYYASDELTIYGEFYALFYGWWSLIVFYIVGYLFNGHYKKIKYSTNLELYCKRSLVILVFFKLYNSFGLDWLLYDIIALFFTYYFFKILALRKSVS